MTLRILSFLVFLLPSFASAAPEPFPDSRVAETTTSTVHRYRLVLSELKRNQAETFGEKEVRLKGELTRTLYELPSGISLSEVAEYFRQQQGTERVLYQCQGIDCGSSNFWANEVFGIGRLVSRDKEQAYLATATQVQGKNRLTVVYISMRGGRQPKVLVDELITADSLMSAAVTENQVTTALSETSGWLPGLNARDGALDVGASAPLLNAIRGLSDGVRGRLHLMVHCYDGVRMSDTIDCAEGIAVQLREQLPDVDVRAQGALTPAPGSDRKPSLRFVFWPGR
ncbi:MAG: DUF4892 domain-containing protein [Thalassolituus sp.]